MKYNLGILGVGNSATLFSDTNCLKEQPLGSSGVMLASVPLL